MFNDKAGLDEAQIFANMQAGEPYKRYKKTILGRLYVNYISPFTGKMEARILSGDPRKGEKGCFFDTWDLKQDMFFRNSNEKHFETGRLVQVPVTQKPQEVQKNVNELTDEDMELLLNSRGFLKLKNALNKITSISVLERMLDIAEQLEKSEGIMKAIKARTSELQELIAASALRED